MSDGRHIWGQTGRFRCGLFAGIVLVYAWGDVRVVFCQRSAVILSVLSQMFGHLGLAGMLTGMRCRNFVRNYYIGGSVDEDLSCMHHSSRDSVLSRF